MPRGDGRTGYYVRGADGQPDHFVHVTMTEYPLNARHGAGAGEERNRRPATHEEVAYWREMDEEMREWEASVQRRWHV